MSRFDAIGVIRNKPNFDENKLNTFEDKINNLLNMRKWNKEEIVELFSNFCQDLLIRKLAST